MVQAVGFLLFGTAGSISAFGVGLTTAAGALTFAGTLVNVAALAVVSSALQPDPPSSPKPDNIKSNSKVSTGDRFLHFGHVYVGGNLAFHRSKDGISYLLFVHGHGEIDGFDTPYLNAIPVSLDANGFVTDDQYIHRERSRVRLITRRGLTPSGYFPEIEEIWPEWTPDHRLDGLSTTLMITESVNIEADRKVYPNGDPNLRWEFRGARFFDPRLGAETFTDNAALVMAGIIAHPDIFGRPEAIDYADLAREADLCDQIVGLAQGGSEPLLRLSGSASLMEEPQNTLSAMLYATGSKAILKPDGRVAIRVGVWREPVLTLTIDDLLEIQEIPGQPGVGEGYNVASARYVDPRLNYTEVDMDPYSDQERIADYGGELERGLDPMLYSPSQVQARRAAKIKMERDNPRTKLRALWRPHVIVAISEPFVRLDLPEFGLQGTYEVASSAETYEAGGLVGVALELNEFRESAMSLGIDEQGEVQELPTPDFDEGVPEPQNVLAAGAGIQSSQNTFGAGIAVIWDEAPSDALSVRVEYKRAISSTWTNVDLSSQSTSHLIPSLEDGQRYDVRVAFVTPSGRLSDYVRIDDVTASASTEAPEPPTELAVEDEGLGRVLVSAVASSSGNLWRTLIFRGPDLVASVVSPPNVQIEFTDEPGIGTFEYTAQSRNVSDVPSDSLAGPVTIVTV